MHYLPFFVVLAAIYALLNSPEWVKWMLGGLVTLAAVGVVAAILYARHLERQAAFEARELAWKERNRPLEAGESLADRLRTVFHKHSLGRVNYLAESYLYKAPRSKNVTKDLVWAVLSSDIQNLVRTDLRAHMPSDLIPELDRMVVVAPPQFRDIFVEPITQQINWLMVAYRDPSMSAIEFERWCERALQWSGWSTNRTKASGDQGADIIASRNGQRAVLQCKLYSRPVGNAAVQEVYAAMRHYNASKAAVVSNQPYTPSARSLAQSTGVHLLHADDLLKFKFE